MRVTVDELGGAAAPGRRMALAPHSVTARSWVPTINRSSGIRFAPSSTVLWATAIACVLFLAGLTYWMAARSAHVEQREATGLLGAYAAAAPMLVGLTWSARRPGSRFAQLIVLLGISAWMLSLEFSDAPLIFAAGVLSEPVLLGIAFYVVLAYPSGRLESNLDKALIGAYAAGILAYFGGRVMSSDQLGPRDLLSACSTRCPENPLHIASLSDSSMVSATANLGLLVAIIATVAVSGELLLRLRTACRPQRRALVCIVPVALILFSAEIANAAFGTFRTAFMVAFALLPLAFLVALLQAEVFAGRALAKFLEDLSTRPSLPRWRNIVARALDDSSVRLALWDPDSRRYREPEAGPMSTAPDGSNRCCVPVHRGADPVGLLSVDEHLAAEPELLQAASVATCLAVEYGHLESELRTSLARVTAAGVSERKRIARDLHDCTQQRLLTLRIHLSLAGDWLDRPEERTKLEEIGDEVDEALVELRSVTHGFYPVVLTQYGIAAALRSASIRAALPVRIEDHGLERHGDAIENAVYFCCLEALQNVAKHAGQGASAVVRLTEQAEELRFEVDDDGVGFVPQMVGRGAGLVNLTDRLNAVGGTLIIESTPGKGARITGRIALS